MKSYLFGALGALTVLILAAIIIPQYCDYRAQSETSVWLNHIRPIQNQIENTILENKTVNDSGLEVNALLHLNDMEYTNITRDGVIFLKGGSEGQFITLIPTIIEGDVIWECVGGSNDNMLPKCKRNE